MVVFFFNEKEIKVEEKCIQRFMYFTICMFVKKVDISKINRLLTSIGSKTITEVLTQFGNLCQLSMVLQSSPLW